MCPLFRFRANEPLPPLEPVAGEFPAVQGAEIAASTFGNRVAGDFYDSFRVGPERVLFGLLDVAGRREKNEKILSTAQSIFHTAGTELFSAPDFNEAEAMTGLCLRLNRGLMEAAGGVISCPAFIACYHEEFGTLCYCNAGHTPGLLRDNTSVTELASTGLPLGLFSHATSDAPIIGIAKGSALLLVSRGVVEGSCKGDKAEDLEFGLERVKEHFRIDPAAGAPALCASVLNSVHEFMCVPVVPDDMTALALTRNG
jgi:phosphoserine phosphatase RsbU/P